jgi:hypothetical protein
MPNHLSYLAALDHAADLRARAERHRLAHQARSVALAADYKIRPMRSWRVRPTRLHLPEEFAPERSDPEADTRIGWVSSTLSGRRPKACPSDAANSVDRLQGIPGSEPQSEVGRHGIRRGAGGSCVSPAPTSPAP